MKGLQALRLPDVGTTAVDHVLPSMMMKEQLSSFMLQETKQAEVWTTDDGTRPYLVQACKDRGLLFSGTKAQLVERLNQHQAAPEKEEDEEEGEEEDEEEEYDEDEDEVEDEDEEEEEEVEDEDEVEDGDEEDVEDKEENDEEEE